MIKKHLASYKYAMQGIRFAFRAGPNMLIHFIASVAVLSVNFVLAISQTEWLITLVLIGIVWAAEIFNTAIEKLADRVTREQDPLIGEVKDLSAGAVLVVCAVAVVCAAVIYTPYIIEIKD